MQPGRCAGNNCLHCARQLWLAARCGPQPLPAILHACSVGTAVRQHLQQQAAMVAANAGRGRNRSACSRYSVLSCFPELPSVSTAPPSAAIGIQQQQQHTLQSCAAASSSRRSSLADIPPEVLSVLLSWLGAADLARLACVCRGLRSSSWEAVPGMCLTLYPHQVGALAT